MSPATSSPAMVGRDVELARLRDALRRTEAGEPASVLIGGEAGIGKSRLTSEFLRGIADEAIALTGWCLDYGSTPAPFGPLPAILRGVLAELGERADAAAGPGRNALHLLLPELTANPVDRSALSPEVLGETIANLLEAASAARPVVIVVEDLHWADAATLSMLSFLLRALAGRRVLFLLTCRIDEVRRGGTVRTFLAEAERARLLDRMTLSRLDTLAVRGLVLGLRGSVDDARLARLMERSEGVPFFIEELICCLEGPLPDTLRELLLSRFDTLGDDAKRVVRVASGSDGAIGHHLLAAVVGSVLTGFADERLEAALREAVTAGILAVHDGDKYAFRHALLREAVHEDLLPGERTRMHAAFAEALEISDGSPAALAFHWHQAHDAPRALHAAVSAMRQAKNSYAFSTAARFGELALELWDQVPDPSGVAGIKRIPLLSQLGSILRNGGDGERALAVVSLAIEEFSAAKGEIAASDAATGSEGGPAAEPAADPATHARLLRDKALYLQNLGRPGAVELLTEALAVIEHAPGEQRLRATLLNHLGGRHLIAGRLAQGVAAADQAFRTATEIGARGAVSVAANLRGCAAIHLGDIETGLDDFRIAWQHAADHDAQLRYRVNYSDALHRLGRYREAVEVAELGVEHSRSLGVERAMGSLLLHNMVEPLIELGEIDRAEAATMHDMSARTLQIFRLHSVMSYIRVLIWRGRIAEATELLNEWAPRAVAASQLERQVWYSLRSVEVLLGLGAGEPGRAAEVLHLVIADEGPRLAQLSRMLLEGARVVSDLRSDGEDDAAAELASALRTAWSERPTGLRFPDWGAVLTAVLDADGPALAEAVRIADGPDAPAVFRVVVRLELARVRALEGDRAGAAELAENAAGIADRLGHDRLQRRVAEFLRVAAPGHRRPGTPSSGSPIELTSRERQVLDLVAAGLSNRQIGERLFISRKTASVHVSAILRKLGASSRTEAAVLAQRTQQSAG